jgi:hypothetical protein
MFTQTDKFYLNFQILFNQNKKKSKKIKKSILDSISSGSSSTHLVKEVEITFNVDKLSSIFPLLGSKHIKELLRLMDNSNKEIRQLIVILFQILLFKSNGKIHLIEKCALGFMSGLYCLSRVKQISSNPSSAFSFLYLIREIREFVQKTISVVQMKNFALKGYF